MSVVTTSTTIAVYAAKGLGDGLLSMIIANQLSLLGHQVTLFSDVLQSLQSWSPHVVIKPYPMASALSDELASFGQVIAADFTPVSRMLDPDQRYTILYQSKFDKSKTMVANLVAYLHRVWNPHATAETGLRVPSGLIHRQYLDRVVIHPTSGEDSKNWLPGKFMRLARELLEKGLSPVFVVSPSEQSVWEWVEPRGFSLVVPADIDQLGRYLYESGYVIDNDSGIGHFASLLLIPTLSLFARASYSRLWRPGWCTGSVVTPFWSLPGSRLKQLYWKELLSVRRVVRAFDKVRFRSL